MGGDLSFLDVDSNGRLYFDAPTAAFAYTDTTAAPLAPVPAHRHQPSPGPPCPSPTPVYFPLNSALLRLSLRRLEAVASGTSDLSWRISGHSAIRGCRIQYSRYPGLSPSPVQWVKNVLTQAAIPPQSPTPSPTGCRSPRPAPIFSRPWGLPPLTSSATVSSIPSSSPIPPFHGREAETARVVATDLDLSLGSLDAVGGHRPAGDAQRAGKHLPRSPAPTVPAHSPTLSLTCPQPPSSRPPACSGLLYDTHRNLLYALKAGEVDVLDPTTLTWKTPLLTNRAFSLNFADMALSPDGTRDGARNHRSEYCRLRSRSLLTATSLVSCPTGPIYQTTSISITQSNVAVLTRTLAAVYAFNRTVHP